MLTYYILDVFAVTKYSGNQLAVIISSKTLNSTEMQKIAQEMHYSETTFILSCRKKDAGYNVRIFTPEKEVPFAGHPTLGTAYLIRQEIINSDVDKIILNLKAGKITVTFGQLGHGKDILWMRQLQPTFGRILKTESLSEVLSLDKADLDDRFPIQEVSTGLPSIIVPLKSLDALKRAKIDRQKYFDLIENLWAKGILIFCSETRKKKNNLSARFFAEYYGVHEDPATGSANGCLAGYLVKYKYFSKNRINIQVEQGYEIGRPSLIYIKAEDKKKWIDVNVGGKVIMIAKGKLI
jgi:trans-2,3-dihydro-3-hydroxyanthranilate isomerase